MGQNSMCLLFCVALFILTVLGLPTLYTRLVGGWAPGGNPQNLAYLDASDRFVDPGCVVILIEDAFNEVICFLFLVH
jgi:hypothetical protein